MSYDWQKDLEKDNNTESVQKIRYRHTGFIGAGYQFLFMAKIKAGQCIHIVLML